MLFDVTALGGRTSKQRQICKLHARAARYRGNSKRALAGHVHIPLPKAALPHF
jgi:hypothetical protein